MTDNRLLPRTPGRSSARPGTGTRSEIDALRLELSAANAELKRRESFMSAVLETIDVGIVFCGPDGTDWTRNRAGRALLGLDRVADPTLGPDSAAPFMDVLDGAGDHVAVDD